MLNELVGIPVEWLAKQREVASQQVALSIVAEGNKPMHDKGERKVVDNAGAEQSRKFKEDPLVMKAALEIEAKRWQHDRRNA